MTYRHLIVFLLSAFFSFGLQAEQIKVGASPVLSSAGIYLAENLGYFKDEGLDVKIVDFASSGAEMTVLLSKNELDVGCGNLSSGLFRAIGLGQGMKIVADKGHVEKGHDYIQFIVRADHFTSGRYKSLKDLKGFKIGVTALNGVSQQIVMDRILKKAGLTEKDIQYVNMSYAEMNVALKAKHLDGAVQLEPLLTKALEEGFAKSVSGSVEVHPTQQSAALIFSPQFLKSKDATRFMRAYLRGVQAYNEAVQGKNTQAADLIKKLFKIDDKIYSKMNPVGLRNDGQIDVPSLMEDIKWYKEKGFIEKSLSEKDVIDLSFIQNVKNLPPLKPSTGKTTSK